MLEEEDGDQLVFEGTCEQGFKYTLMIKAKKVLAHRWGWGRRTRRAVEYMGVLNWVKKPASETDYGVDYAMTLWR